MKAQAHKPKEAKGTSTPSSKGGSVQFKDERLESKRVTQLKQVVASQPIQRKANNTGLPNQLKSGIENLSGHSMDDVKVHFNSAKPAQLQAHAYAQGNQIHLGPGQEKHLPHEAWHVVQQKQGRVKPTMQMKGKLNINDNAGLEKEADVMGEKALQMKYAGPFSSSEKSKRLNTHSGGITFQRAVYPSAHVRMISDWNPDNEAWPGTNGATDKWAGTGAIKGTGVNSEASALCRNVEKVTAALSSQQDMGSPHMAPKRMGGKGDTSNVRPWKKSFEITNWHGSLDNLVKNEFKSLSEGKVFYEDVETDESHKLTNAWLKTLQDKFDSAAASTDKTKLGAYLTHLKAVLSYVPDGARIKTPGGGFSATGSTFDPSPINMGKAKVALNDYNGGDLDNVHEG